MRARRHAAAVAIALFATGCLELTGSDTPPVYESPEFVSVNVEYRQPNGCLNVSTPCHEPVYFFASWMRPNGSFIELRSDPGSFVWRGTATGVPVNFPPRDYEPYLVRVFDPYLREGPGGGITAQRLRVGGQLLTRFDSAGSSRESGLVFIDANGIGHNPY